MNPLPSNFCIAPFVQTTTHPSQSFSPCPYLGGTVWPGVHGDILSQWTSNGLEDLRRDFLNNKKNTICNRCWHEEDNGKKSLRLRLFDPSNATSDFTQFSEEGTLDRLTEKILSKSYLAGPEILTIKNGNICNAKCRVCHPGDSSRWISDARKLYKILGEQYYPIDKKEINWSDEQIDEIFFISKNLKRLELFGGEPMYNKKVHSLLKRIVDSKESDHITLYINTNGSVDIVDKIPFIKEFRKIEIGVSIDAVGKHFDYIRHGLDYETVKKNVLRWHSYFQMHNVDYFIDSISTVEILNVFYLPELKEEVMKILPLSPFWNVLINPAYLFIKNMPDNLKLLVTDKLSSDSDFDDLIRIMQQPADLSEWEKFVKVTQTLDTIRKEDFSKTFPEFFDLLNNKN